MSGSVDCQGFIRALKMFVESFKKPLKALQEPFKAIQGRLRAFQGSRERTFLNGFKSLGVLL
jgi:hypothetical protein